MRRRAPSASVLAIEQAATRGRGRRACSRARSTRCGRARGTTSCATIGRGAVVGYAGLLVQRRRGPRHQHRRRTRPPQRAVSATACSLALADEAIERGCTAWTLEVRVVEHRRPGAVPAFGFVPGRDPAALLREHRGRHRDVVPRHPTSRRRTARPARRGLPRRTIGGWRSIDRSTTSTLVLGIETSCDETAAALVMGGRDVRVERGVDAGRTARRVRRGGARDRVAGPPRAAQPGGRPDDRRGRRRRVADRRRRLHRRARV